MALNDGQCVGGRAGIGHYRRGPNIHGIVTWDIGNQQRRAFGWMANKCRRTQFIWEILVPLFSVAALMDSLSSGVSPGTGATNSEEHPPEISVMTISSALWLCTRT